MSGFKYYKYDPKHDCYIITDLETGSKTIQTMQKILEYGQLMKENQKRYYKNSYEKKLKRRNNEIQNQ